MDSRTYFSQSYSCRQGIVEIMSECQETGFKKKLKAIALYWIALQRDILLIQPSLLDT